MREAIRRRAFELGFDECRFTTAAAPDTAPRFQEWLAAGQHGEMSYLLRTSEKRVSPQLVLSGVKSIISLGVSYAGKVRGVDADLSVEPQGMFPVGVVARYARFGDYHSILEQSLKRLVEFIQALPGENVRCLAYVDTGPVLERGLAQRAGVGFVGKHTNLISRRLGNWFFICEVLTTCEFVPDSSEVNRCGSCTRCMDACPTRAIYAPFQLDARRCISYLTIELKGSIPVEFREAVGNRIFGCDDCLAVCPWNRFAREGALMKSHARPELGQLELLELLALDEPSFKKRFAGTPLVRSKRRGLLRNVCVALGNVGDSEALKPLERAAHDPEPLVAEHAQWAIGRIRQRLKF